MFMMGRFPRGRGGFRREPGSQEEFVLLFIRQAKQFGASGDIVPVSRPGGRALLPADEGLAAYRDPTRKLSVADSRPVHVGGQEFGKSLQLLHL